MEQDAGIGRAIVQEEEEEDADIGRAIIRAEEDGEEDAEEGEVDILGDARDPLYTSKSLDTYCRADRGADEPVVLVGLVP